MKKFWKSIIMGSFLTAMSFLVACSSATNGDKTTENTQGGENTTANEQTAAGGGKGRYMEEEYTLSEEIQGIFSMNRLKDGTIRVAAAGGMYDSADKGKTWKKHSPDSTVFDKVAKDEEYIWYTGLDGEGNAFIITQENASEEFKYYYIDNQGTERILNAELPGIEPPDAELPDDYEMKNFLDSVKFTTDGNILGKSAMGGGIYLIDKDSGEILQTYGEEGSYGISFTCVGDKLLIYDMEGINFYDIASGSLLETEAPLNDYFKPTDTGGMSEVQIKAGQGENELYFVDSTGLYRYAFGSSTVESVINGALNSISNPGYTIIDLLAQEDNTFLILYADNNSRESKLMHYAYSEEVSAVPSKEINIYALKDNQNIRQAISLFQKDNPDYYVHLEVGMTGDDAVTVSDALRTLNTNIMAGNGPDILLLDGMPINSYIDKGLLYNLSETIDQARTENAFYENILNTNKSEDGLYAVPTRFSVPIVMGEEKNLEKVKNLDTLADLVERLRKEDGEIGSILGQYTGEKLADLFYSISSASLMQEDGTINKENLTQFLTQVKKIYDANKLEENVADVNISVGNFMEDISQNLIGILNKKQKLNIANLSSLNNFNVIQSSIQRVDWNYNIFKDQDANTFIPMDTVGVNAKGENIEESLEFVKVLLSQEMQKLSLSEGFPVNADAFGEICHQIEADSESSSLAFSMMGDDGEYTMLEVEPGTPEQYDRLKDYVKTLDTPSNTNNIIREAILTEAADCMSGDTPISEAVEKILKAVNLYLAE